MEILEFSIMDRGSQGIPSKALNNISSTSSLNDNALRENVGDTWEVSEMQVFIVG